MGIAFIIFMGLFIKCCAVHTPSSNPKKPPARRFSETLRRPMNTFRRMVSGYQCCMGVSLTMKHEVEKAKIVYLLQTRFMFVTVQYD
jgi:heme/copper-type cytochrome/quinol oxidase subunit 3